MVHLLLLLACEPKGPELWTATEDIVPQGPCDCPQALDVESVTATWHPDLETQRFTALNAACEPLFSVDAGEDGVLAPGHDGAWSVGDPVWGVACPNQGGDGMGHIHFQAYKGLCWTELDWDQGPEVAQLPVTPWRRTPATRDIRRGDRVLMPCGEFMRPTALGWQASEPRVTGPEGVREVTWTWEAAPKLELQILDAAGDPLPNELVLVMAGQSRGQYVVTDAEGRLGVGAGHFPFIMVHAEGSGLGMVPGWKRSGSLTLEPNSPETWVLPTGEALPGSLDSPNASAVCNAWLRSDLQSCHGLFSRDMTVRWLSQDVALPEGEQVVLDAAQFTGSVSVRFDGPVDWAYLLRQLPDGEEKTVSDMFGLPSLHEGDSYRFPNVPPGKYHLKAKRGEVQRGWLVVVGAEAVDKGLLSMEPAE